MRLYRDWLNVLTINVLTISLSLITIACSPTQANQFACEQPQTKARSPQSYTGTANGELKVDGKVISLTRAVAIATDRVWDDFKYLPGNQPSQSGWAVLLTEQDMTDNQFREFLLSQSVPTNSILDGSIRGVLITSQDTAGYTLKLLYPPPPGWGFSTFTAGVEAGNLQIKDGEIAGEIADAPPLIQNFAYRLSFQAPLQQQPFATQVFPGEAAFDTPPVRLYLAYVDALEQKNLNQMRRYLTTEHGQGLNKLVAEMGETQFFAGLNEYISLSRAVHLSQTYHQLEALQSRLGKDRFAALAALSVSRGFISGDRASLKQYLYKLVIRGGMSKLVLKVNPTEPNITSATTLSITCENGSWKL